MNRKFRSNQETKYNITLARQKSQTLMIGLYDGKIKLDVLLDEFRRTKVILSMLGVLKGISIGNVSKW